MKNDALLTICGIRNAFFPCLLMMTMGMTSVHADEVTYLAPAANGNNNWSSPSTWLGGTAPTPTNSVLINSLPTGNVSLLIDYGPGTYTQEIADLTFNASNGLRIRNANQSTNTVTLNVTGDLTKDGTGNLRIESQAGGSIALRVEGDLEINAGAVRIGTSAALAQNLALLGNTTINGGELSLRLSNRSATTPVELGNVNVAAGASLSLFESTSPNADTQYFRLTGLNGGGAISATNTSTTSAYIAQIAIDTSTGANLFSGTINEISGAEGAQTTISLTKDGTGSLTLSGSNAYSGGTTVTAGTLVVSGSAALGTGSVTVSGGALSTAVSNLDIGGPLSMSVGAMDINGSSVGSITLDEAVNLTLTGGTVNLDILSSSSFDQIFGNGGTFSISGVTFDLTGSTLAEGQYAVLAGFASGDISNVSFIGVSGWQVDLGNDGILKIHAVPEPKTFVFILAALTLALWKRPSRA